MDVEQYGREISREHWEWLGTLLEHVYKDAFEHGFKHGVEVKGMPPSPPAEAEVQRLRMIITLAKEALGKGWNPIWELELAESPAEMPEVDPLPNIESLKQMGGDAPPIIHAPVVEGYCILYTKETVDKKANSCEGCKVAGCANRGRAKTE